MKWLNAKCNKCGFKKEVILFLNITKPQAQLKCPECESLDVIELKEELQQLVEQEKADYEQTIK